MPDDVRADDVIDWESPLLFEDSRAIARRMKIDPVVLMQLDRVIRSVLAGMTRYDGKILVREDRGIVPTIVDVALPECRQAGLRVSRYQVSERVLDFCFGIAE